MLEQSSTPVALKPVYEGIVTSYRPSPFALPGDYITHHAMAGQSIAEIIEDIAPDWQHPYLRVVLNDEVIAKDDWALTVPCKDDTLNIILVPQGGDAGQIFKMIAVIVVQQ